MKDKNEIKYESKKKLFCPFCNQEITIGIELHVFKNIHSNINIPHIYLHGNPLHALICYINKKLVIRNIGIIKSIEISRDSETLNQIKRKWSNPY